jgi:hypothetical protein
MKQPLEFLKNEKSQSWLMVILGLGGTRIRPPLKLCNQGKFSA